MLANYDDETVQNKEETRYRMHLYWYEQKIRQCEVLLAHTSFIQALKTAPPSLDVSVESVVDPNLCSGQLPSQGIREVGWSSTAKWDAGQADALTAVQQISQLLP